MRPPPGPRGREVLGFFGRGDGASTLDFLEKTARQYGPLSSFRILSKRVYLVDDADLLKDIFVTRQHSFERDAGAKLLKELVGDSVITREEPQHKERRRMLQPAFHREQIASYARIMTTECQRLRGEWQEGQELDIRAQMRQLTLAIVGSSLFGADFRDDASKVSDILLRVGRNSRWLAPAIYFVEPVIDLYRKIFPRGRSLFFERERQELHAVLRPLLAADRRSDGPLSMMALLAGEEGIIDELVTFMLAGHETTATALTWTWYLLAHNPRVERKLHLELDQVLAGRPATLEDLPQLQYTSLVFQEALRLYPPALAFARRSKETLDLGGYTLPKGSSVFVSPYITQRNERYFEKAEAFEPERWENNTFPKFAYFPFGGGAKTCIGEPFAKLEGVLALATLAQEWQLRLKDLTPIGIGQGMILRPATPIVMTATRRRAAVGTALVHGIDTMVQFESKLGSEK